MKPNSIKAILFVLFLGILDTAYLTWEHFANTIPPCSASVFVDCGKVLRSQYSTLLGIPLAAIGLANYLGSASLVILSIKTRKRVFGYLLLLQTVAGALTSVYLMYLQ